VDIIDVSGHNTINNWRAVRGQASAVWVKATQGSGYTSPAFSSQALGAASAGLKVGAYHFADSNVSPAANWAHFQNVVKPFNGFADGCLAPLLDMENDPTDGITWYANTAPMFIASFIAAYRQDTGQRKIVVYANTSDWLNIMHPERWADADTYLMCARYGTPPSPGNTGGFTHPQLAVHQYTAKASVDGSAGLLDASVLLNHTLTDLTLGAAPRVDDEEDDVNKVYPHQLFQAGGHPDVNNGQPVFPFGVWRDDQGVWVGLASQGEFDSVKQAYQLTPVWLEQATLSERVRISRIGVDTARP
jgi:lysozyme